MQFRYIYQPTDFSETSLNAYKVATDIARRSGSEIHLVHVYDKPYYSVSNQQGGITFAVDNEGLKDIKHEIREELMKLKEMEISNGIPLYKFLVADVPIWEFYEHLDSEKADLIVMGTKGATGFFHGGLFGTNTEKVIRHSPYPVLSIPGAFNEFKSFDRILFATDFQDDLSDVFPHVLDFARLYNSEIFVAIINTRDNISTTRFANEKFNELVAKFPYDKISLLIQNDFEVERGIETLADLYDVQLVSMITHGRTGIAHLIKGSIAEELSANMQRPLLTFKAK